MSYPKAEQFAENRTLPLTVCQTTKELYGYAVPVLDVKEAAFRLARGLRITTTSPPFEAAMAILEERVAALS